MDLTKKNILLTGGGGFLGKHVFKKLLERGVSADRIYIPRSKEHDLRDPAVCEKLVQGKDVVIHLAAAVGGIGFNRKYPGKAFYDNASMAMHLLEAFRKSGGEKFVGIGTVCAYPKILPAPFSENDLWAGYPEETNAPYGLAKKMMLVQSQAYRQEYGTNAIHLLMVNLYGPKDNFHPENSHVIPALIDKIAEAKKNNQPSVEVWGTGKATREFLFAEDAAEAIVAAAEKYNSIEPVNIGSGQEVSIKDLVDVICRLVGFNGEIRWNADKPDGQPRRVLDISRAEKEFGFKAQTTLEAGLKKTIDWYYKIYKK
ncbi:MAG: GDP-L-fucose synthase [Parcubacteria group bacterium Gr01-1014_3]|nr:MAG: GDP-L-fucose synthase [Parcubacteria group bacterium Gr01-1014_3]